MTVYWPLVRQLLLTLVAIYFVGGAIMFSVQLLQNLELATPLSAGAIALLVAFLAKLIIRDDLK